jgi:hypothetical protein
VIFYLEPVRRIERFKYLDPLSGQDPELLRLKAHLDQAAPAFLILSQAELDLLKLQFPSFLPRLHVWQTFRLGLGERCVLAGNAVPAGR